MSHGSQEGVDRLPILAQCLNRHSDFDPMLESAADSSTFCAIPRGIFDPMLEPAADSSTFRAIARQAANRPKPIARGKY